MQKFLHILAFGVSAFIAYCLVVLQTFPILHDFPEWMYQGWIFSALLSGDEPAVAQSFGLVGYPVPNSISQFGIGLLNYGFSPVVAGKVWLGAYLVFASALWFVVSRHNNNRHDGALHLLLTMLITLGPGFWNGYINYQLGLLLFALYLYATVFRGVSSRLWLFVFSLLIFFSHAIVFAVFLLFHVLSVVFAWNKRRWIDFVALAPSVLLLIWYSMFKLASSDAYSSQALGLVKFVQYKAYTMAKQGPFHNFIGHDGQSLLEGRDVLYQFGFAVNFFVALVLVLWFVSLGRALLRGETKTQVRFDIGRFHWPVILSLFILATGFLLGGKNLFGLVNPGERLLIVALVMALMFYRPPLSALNTLTAASAIFSVYLMMATFNITKQPLESYSVARSADTSNLQQYVGDIYANSRHKYFNHRLYIYADRGIELTRDKPLLLPLDLATSVVINRTYTGIE